MAAIAASAQNRKKGRKAERSRKKASIPEIPKMPKPLRDRVIRERPDNVQVIEVAPRDPIVVVTKNGAKKVVGAWIDI